MHAAVVIAALAVAALNALAAVAGGLRWWYAVLPERIFWRLLRVAQGSAVAFALATGGLAAAGDTASQKLFYLYALLPIAIALIAEQLRVSSAQFVLYQRGLPDAQAVGGLPDDDQRRVVGAIVRREVGVMALAAAVVVFLALRAASTAHGI